MNSNMYVGKFKAKGDEHLDNGSNDALAWTQVRSELESLLANWRRGDCADFVAPELAQRILEADGTHEGVIHYTARILRERGRLTVKNITMLLRLSEAAIEEAGHAVDELVHGHTATRSARLATVMGGI